MELRLHPRQGEAFLSPATEILYGGQAGGGKSHLMRAAAISWCYDIPGLQVYLFRRLYPDLAKNHMEGPSGFPAMLPEWVGRKFARINYSDNEIAFANGSKIFLCHCQYEKDVYKYQGAEIHVLMLDELTHFTEFQYRYLRGRNRMAGVNLPARYAGLFPRILAASNPGGAGHNWVKAAFIDPAPPMRIWRAADSDGGKLRQFIPAALRDNPSLNADEYSATLAGLGRPDLVKAMLCGSWDIVAGGMFDDVWREGTHVVKPFDIPSSWRIDRSFDWGSSKPFSVGWWAESDGTDFSIGCFPRGTLFRIAEMYGWNGRPNEGCKALAVEVARRIVQFEAAVSWGRRVQPGPADSSIYAAENGVCIADDMARAGVRWQPADKSPGSRRSGWERMRGMLKASTEIPREHPGLFVFDTCRQFIRTVPVLPRDERNQDDIDTDAEDHVADEARYRCSAVRHTVQARKLTGY